MLWQYGVESIPGINGKTNVNYMQENSNLENSPGRNFVKINPDEWIKNHIGKVYDIDGAYGIQCVDLGGRRIIKKGYPNHNRPIGGDEWAHSIWYNREALGLPEYFNCIQGELQVGDIVIWGKNSPDCPYSHVAMYAGGAEGVNRGLIFGANQGTEHSAGNIMALSCDGTLGAFRYKGFTTRINSVTIPTIKDEGEYSVYRLYNPNSGEHIYTTSLQEANTLRQLGLEYEGVGWVSPSTGQPVYRLYNNEGGLHMYSMSSSEISSLKNAGWKNEGVAFYSNGTKPVFRLLNPHNGIHHFTKNYEEKQALLKYGWVDEGIGFYIFA